MNITKNQKILIGIGVVALGYYLYTKNKKETTIVEATTASTEEMSNILGEGQCRCSDGSVVTNTTGQSCAMACASADANAQTVNVAKPRTNKKIGARS
jgi:hypothetical protein